MPSSFKDLVPLFKSQMQLDQQDAERGSSPDILVVGLQEIVQLNAMNMLQGENQAKMNEWEQLLRSAIEFATLDVKDPEERYVWVVAKSMVGCYIGLFVKHKLLSRITDLKTTKIKTGVWGSSGNKGAVMVRFNLDDTSIMLMNCHLMSGKNKAKQRTDELNFIFDNAFKEHPRHKVMSKC